MAEGRGRAAWEHTATILAMLANCHRDPRKGRTYRSTDFNPYEARRVVVKDMRILKTIFVDGMGKKGVQQ